MARRSPAWKVTYSEPVPPRLARNTVIESTFEVGRRFHCTQEPNFTATCNHASTAESTDDHLMVSNEGCASDGE
jgi:hypothetical protein